MGYLNDFMTLGIIAFLGAVSPGPDFVIVTQSTLSHGKKAGIYTAMGIAAGCLIHISYSILGIGVILKESVIWFDVIKYVGAIYLIYLGIKAIVAKPTAATAKNASTKDRHQTSSSFDAFKKGFFVNLLNPKVALFILSIFTQVIDPITPLEIQAAYGLEFCLIAFCWFTLLSFILSNPTLRKKLLGVQNIIEKILGGFLILLGIKVASFNF